MQARKFYFSSLFRTDKIGDVKTFRSLHSFQEWNAVFNTSGMSLQDTESPNWVRLSESEQRRRILQKSFSVIHQLGYYSLFINYVIMLNFISYAHS